MNFSFSTKDIIKKFIAFVTPQIIYICGSFPLDGLGALVDPRSDRVKLLKDTQIIFIMKYGLN